MIAALSAAAAIATVAAMAPALTALTFGSIGIFVLALLLLWLAAVYSSAPWASFAAEGIRLTPLRAAYRRSSQSTGDWPQSSGVPIALRLLVPATLIAAAAVGALLLFTPGAPNQTPPPADAPPIGQQVPPVAVSTPTPTPRPTATPT